jgi:pilus assembly protein CpaE
MAVGGSKRDAKAERLMTHRPTGRRRASPAKKCRTVDAAGTPGASDSPGPLEYWHAASEEAEESVSGRATEPLRVLCVSPDGSAAGGVAAMLASLGDFVCATRTARYRDALTSAKDLDLAIVVLDEHVDTGLAVIESLGRGRRGGYIVVVSPDDSPDTIVRTLRAGADEHLSLPLSQHDLFKVCVKVAEGGAAAARDAGGELWVVYGPKGGIGATTLAVNLAVALRVVPRDVALVDLDVDAGDAAFFLNMQPKNTLRDVVANYGRLDAVLLQGAMVRHASGVAILAASGPPPLEPTAEQTIGILELVTGMQDVTIVNTPGSPSSATRAALAAADRVLLVTDLTVAALRACARTIEWLAGEGVDANAVELIVNRHDARATDVSLADVARMIPTPVRAVLPYDDAALAAANAGQPLADGTPLQRAIAEFVSPGGRPARPSRLRRGLTRLFSGRAA